MNKAKVNSTELRVSWKREYRGAEFIALIYAINHGYGEAKELIDILPQFSKHRLEIALTSLLSVGLVKKNGGAMVVSSDAMIIDRLTQMEPMILPVDHGEVNIRKIISIYEGLGIKEPNVALSVLRHTAKDFMGNVGR
ncbi:MAG: hypothetical protein RPT25_10740 [Cycloclasticus sp.]|jgi:hypothetical protein